MISPLRAVVLLCLLSLVACSGADSGVQLADSSTTPSVSSATTAPSSTASSTTQPTSTETSTTLTTTTTSPAESVAALSIPVDQDSLIEALTRAEEAIRNPAVDDTEAYAWGVRQQRLYRLLADHPEWGDAVVAGVSEEARYGVQQNWAARQALSKLVRSGPLAETLPAWRLREPLPVAELLGYYHEAEELTGIGWNYLAAINLIETRMGRIEGLSTAGATGPMQFLPSTWDECCEGDPTVDRDAIIGAGTYLVRVGGLDDITNALYRYNNSDRYVNAVSFYAEVLAENELAYRGYHAWQVYFLSASGLILMPSDYYQPEPISVDEWLVDHPEALLSPAQG